VEHYSWVGLLACVMAALDFILAGAFVKSTANSTALARP
jgi:hypothetical protein